MSNHEAAYSRRLIRVCRGIAGVIAVGVVGVASGLVDVQVYNNEVEYTKHTPDRGRFKPHRCNDRLADMLDVVESEDGNMWRDFRPTFRNWWACMRSEEGQEPAMPYLMLRPKDKQYVPLSARSPAALQQLQQQQQQQQAQGATQ